MPKSKNKENQKNINQENPEQAGVKKELAKETRIKREVSRLAKNFEDIEPQKRKVVKGLIERAAFLRVCLMELEEDINENGYTELFSQSPTQTPYERQRPNVATYNSINGNYQKIIKQLTDLIPKEPPKLVDDGFDNFIFDRK